MPEERRELVFPRGSLVLVAGLPGAGKSTLLRRIYGLTDDERTPVEADGALVIDSRQARNTCAPYLRPVPARARIPFVYALHVWRIGRAVLAGRAVVAHTRGTWPLLTRAFARLAARAGHETHVILLDVPPEIALEGQHKRGRTVTPVTFARQVRRWREVLERARHGRLTVAASAMVLDRAEADRVERIRFR
ncbi:AAA domain-containing protein [Actinocorallia herbida]|uniref:AAA domain-containing protein n=1 Tax=Actinocorallia herbida TaxID=58109 RepID=A0A3N1CS26_9ACTN|nr:AAA family ATPase [Actinocorallia herbida]ROO84122.1 AAA domain-containing protein [Actinocorallia herbida]